MTPVRAERDLLQLEELSRVLRDAASTQGRRQCAFIDPRGKKHPLPDLVFFLLERITGILERGDAVSVVRVGKDLTTQQAADLLNMSRQYLVRLLEDGRIPFSKTGKHRRLKLTDVLLFKVGRDRERRAMLGEITAIEETGDEESKRAVDDLAAESQRLKLE